LVGANLQSASRRTLFPDKLNHREIMRWGDINIEQFAIGQSVLDRW